MNEQRARRKKRPPHLAKVAAAAEKVRELVQAGHSPRAISDQLEADGLPGLAVDADRRGQRKKPPKVPVTKPADDQSVERMLKVVAMTTRDILDRVQEAQDLFGGELKRLKDDMGATQRLATESVDAVGRQLAAVETRIELLTQILNKLDPLRLNQAVEGLERARQAFESPPLRKSVAEAAAEIRSGSRPPRHKLGVTIDGALWAAVQHVQLTRRCTISDILDEALRLWVEGVSAPS